MIGIGVTTHNRDTLKNTLYNIKKFTPHAKVIVIDDASSLQVVSDYRFNENVGIGKAKNKCLELLEDCEHIFLFDDDCYPVVLGWEQHYINAAKETDNLHLCFTFDKFSNGQKTGNFIKRKWSYRNQTLLEYQNPCGCMMYINNEVLKQIGGINSNYGKYGHEHVGYSYRACNADLTVAPFLDIKNSLDLFYSHDQKKTVVTSVGLENKRKYCEQNNVPFENDKKVGNWYPYKKINVVIGVYYTNQKDTQRPNYNHAANLYPVKEWIKSVTEKGYHAILLTNRIVGENTDLFKNIWWQSSGKYSVYQNKWIDCIDWILENQYYLNEVWITDTTDVEMINLPKVEEDKIYVGVEEDNNSCQWINARNSEHKALYKNYNDIVNPNSRLLNAGVFGGNLETILPVIKEFQTELKKFIEPIAEMPLINYLGYKHRFEFGKHVTTPFKKYVYNSAWFKHK